MCRTRHIHRTVSISAVNDYLDAFLSDQSLDSKDGSAIKKLQALKDQVLRLRERGGLVVVTTLEKDTLLTTYALNSYRRH